MYHHDSLVARQTNDCSHNKRRGRRDGDGCPALLVAGACLLCVAAGRSSHKTSSETECLAHMHNGVTSVYRNRQRSNTTPSLNARRSVAPVVVTRHW